VEAPGAIWFEGAQVNYVQQQALRQATAAEAPESQRLLPTIVASGRVASIWTCCLWALWAENALKQSSRP
jgi:hypothetical protein